jgi:hypothetical protein
MAPRLTIELKKTKDGKPSLACVRADGSRTWAKLHPFFPTHDLTHCAVESVLGFDQAFFGMIASGWGIDDFATPGAATRLGQQALCAENIVGHIERGVAIDAAELNAALAMNTELAGFAPCATVTDAQLAAIRTLRSELTRKWWELPEGETLRIGFPAT